MHYIVIHYIVIPTSLHVWILKELERINPAYKLSYYVGRDGRPRFVAYGGVEASPAALITDDLRELVTELVGSAIARQAVFLSRTDNTLKARFVG